MLLFLNFFEYCETVSVDVVIKLPVEIQVTEANCNHRVINLSIFAVWWCVHAGITLTWWPRTDQFDLAFSRKLAALVRFEEFIQNVVGILNKHLGVGMVHLLEMQVIDIKQFCFFVFKFNADNDGRFCQFVNLAC